jgi:hypothetical protein
MRIKQKKYCSKSLWQRKRSELSEERPLSALIPSTMEDTHDVKRSASFYSLPSKRAATNQAFDPSLGPNVVRALRGGRETISLRHDNPEPARGDAL